MWSICTRSLRMVMFLPSSRECTHPTRVSLQTGVNVRHHALLLILVQLSLHVKPPHGIHHICIWICGLKNQHVQTHGSEAFLILSPPPVTSTTGCFTHSGVSHPNLHLFYLERKGVTFQDTPLLVRTWEVFLMGGL